MVVSSLSLLWCIMRPLFPNGAPFCSQPTAPSPLHVLFHRITGSPLVFLPSNLSQPSLSSAACLTWQACSSVEAFFRYRPREAFLKHMKKSVIIQPILLAGDNLFCCFPQGLYMHPYFPWINSVLPTSFLNSSQATMVTLPRTVVATPAWFRAGLTNSKTYEAREAMFRNVSERSRQASVLGKLGTITNWRVHAPSKGDSQESIFLNVCN